MIGFAVQGQGALGRRPMAVADDILAWKTAHAVTALALADDTKDGPMQILASATNYHADYVDPYWAKSLNRLTKIGRHIFYSQG